MKSLPTSAVVVGRDKSLPVGAVLQEESSPGLRELGTRDAPPELFSRRSSHWHSRKEGNAPVECDFKGILPSSRKI